MVSPASILRLILTSVLLLSIVNSLQLPGGCPTTPESFDINKLIEERNCFPKYDLIPRLTITVADAIPSHIFKELSARFKTKIAIYFDCLVPNIKIISIYENHNSVYFNHNLRKAELGFVSVKSTVTYIPPKPTLKILKTHEYIGPQHMCNPISEKLKLWYDWPILILWSCAPTGSNHQEGLAVIQLGPENRPAPNVSYRATLKKYISNDLWMAVNMTEDGMGDISSNSLWTCTDINQKPEVPETDENMNYLYGIIVILLILCLIFFICILK